MRLKNILEIKFFLSGDESGELHKMEFDSHWNANQWKKEMKESARIFSEQYTNIIE
jgi:hypothetical protein